MRHLDFDELWKNHLFDYKDGDLLVIDDIRRLELSDYENTALDFVMAVFCMEGHLQFMVDGKKYSLFNNNFFVYVPGQVLADILLSQNANVKVIAFAQRAIDRSLYLHKFIWQNISFIKEHPLFTLSERELQGLNHYYQLLMIKTQESEGSFQHDVVRLLFQAQRRNRNSPEEKRFFRAPIYTGLSPFYGFVGSIRWPYTQRVILCQYAERHSQISLQMCERRVWSPSP